MIFQRSVISYLFLGVCALALISLFVWRVLRGKGRPMADFDNKEAGNGQFGSARFATEKEKESIYTLVPYEPKAWRDGIRLPDASLGGIVVGYKKKKGKEYALVDTGDVHAMMIGAAGVGKTAYFLYPNLEYACACGLSFLTTDTKGDLYRIYAAIAQEKYGYRVSVLDYRNPAHSSEYNLLHLVNYYTDLSRGHPERLQEKAKAEKYAKIIAKTIILSGGGEGNFGQNAFFYDAAEGLLASTILLVSEFCEPKDRHIVSVFKIIQDLMAGGETKGATAFQSLLNHLPESHKARWLAGAAISSSKQAMASVMSTAMSRLNAFLDSELEQVLCFGTDIDAEKFCHEKCAVFIVLPEEDNSKYFLVSLTIQQFYREILSVADEYGGKLPQRVMMYLDEFGTIPTIQSAEMMFSASRSRRVSIVAIIQSYAQLRKNYGADGGEIIGDNTQLTIFGGFAPQSQSAKILSDSLGTMTIQSPSVSENQQGYSTSTSLVGRPLLPIDELKSIPKGTFMVTKTGSLPMKSTFKLFLEWGIEPPEEEYAIREKEIREVSFAHKDDILRGIVKYYGTMDEVRRKDRMRVMHEQELEDCSIYDM